MLVFDGNDSSVNNHKPPNTKSDLYKYFSNFSLNSGDCQILNTRVAIDNTGKNKRLKNEIKYRVRQGWVSKSVGIPITALQPLNKPKHIITSNNFILYSFSR